MRAALSSGYGLRLADGDVDGRCRSERIRIAPGGLRIGAHLRVEFPTHLEVRANGKIATRPTARRNAGHGHCGPPE